MWTTFLNVSSNKAMVLTTRQALECGIIIGCTDNHIDSMEEAAVLSTRVGILANRMLASGSTEALVAEHGTYEVLKAAYQFGCFSELKFQGPLLSSNK
jgi:hypothetical protein